MKFQTLQELQDSVRQGDVYKYKFFWGGFLSNWYDRAFVVEGVKYWCVEQYMMQKKALCFDDFEIATKIMQSLDQREIKQLGREVRGYVDEKWASVRQQVVYEGNYAKFKCNEDLGRYLVRTGDKVLVEASPYDTLWGIGMGESSPLIGNPLNWNGQNYLGFVLMAVREELRKEGVQ